MNLTIIFRKIHKKCKMIINFKQFYEVYLTSQFWSNQEAKILNKPYQNKRKLICIWKTLKRYKWQVTKICWKSSKLQNKISKVIILIEYKNHFKLTILINLCWQNWINHQKNKIWKKDYQAALLVSIARISG